MCYGENNADHCAEFINSQFQAYWNIARQCADAYDGYKPEAKQHQYSLSLYEFHHGRHKSKDRSIDDLVFYGQFGAPSVDFICNHAAIITITVQYGQFYDGKDYTPSAPVTNAGQPQFVSEGQKFLFLVPVKIEGIAGRATAIGASTSEYKIELIIFDYKKAQFLMTEPKEVTGWQSLKTHMSTYIAFLQSAGYHSFFSLPSFGDDPAGRSMKIDHSLMVQPRHLDMMKLDKVHEIDVVAITKYVRTAWVKAAMLVGAQTGGLENRPSASIAEYSNAWTAHSGSVFFHLRFAPPEVIALCDHEVIVRFLIDDIMFYTSDKLDGEAFQKFSEWTVALVTEFKYEQPEPEIQILKLDVTRSRFLKDFSVFGESSTKAESEEEIRHCLHHVIHFVEQEYLNVLESADYHIIYKHDTRWSANGEGEDLEMTFVSDEGEWHRYSTDKGELTSKTAAWRYIIQNSNMGLYDQITALSEAAINNYFRDHFVADSLLSKWTHGTFSDVEFESPTVRLRRDSRTAIVVFNLKHGKMKYIHHGELYEAGDLFDLEDWRVAFEVSLKMGEHATLKEQAVDWAVNFEGTAVATEYARYGDDVDYKHLYLDFNGADVKFLHEFSNFEALFTKQHRGSVGKVQATVFYLRKHYIPEFVKSGFHILHTIPVWKKRHQDYPYGLNDAHFHVYASQATVRQEVHEHQNISHSTIVIVGNCDEFGTPAIPMQFWSKWVAHAGRFASYGTVGLSSKLFLNAKGGLLDVLSRINADTSIIPKFSGITAGKWDLKLVGWSSHEERQNSPCPFGLKQDNPSEDVLEYVWHCKDDWDYQHQHGHGDHHFVSGNFKVMSETTNRLFIPTVFKSGTMEIKMQGDIRVALNVDDQDSWKSETHASWTASLFVHSEPSGLRATMVSSPISIKVDNTEGTGAPLATKPDLLLAGALPKTVVLRKAEEQFDHLKHTWKSCYPGAAAYRLANPVFNRRGDILFEVLPHVATQAQNEADGTSQSRIAPPAAPGLANVFGRRPGRQFTPRRGPQARAAGDGGDTPNGNANPAAQ